MKSAEPMLRDRRILVVEDDYFIADGLARILARAGAEVIGPCPSVKAALNRLETEAHLVDAAVLDVNLGGEDSYSIADALDARDVPYVFVSGYGSPAIAPRYRDHPRLEKPVQPDVLILLLAKLAA